MIEEKLKAIFQESIKSCVKKGVFAFDAAPAIEFDKPKREEHGDSTTNIAMIIASKTGKKPLDIANAIINTLEGTKGLIKKVEAVRPGFINITIEPKIYLECLHDIYKAGKTYGQLTLGGGSKLQIEFVSANPTGPLHIGHGRGAVVGDVLGNIMKAAGYEVVKEYYVNDTGVQIKTLGESVYLRMLELRGEKITFPEKCYQGEYIVHIARELLKTSWPKISSMSKDDAETFCGRHAAEKILEEIKEDLAKTGVVHDLYFYENHLHTDAQVERVMGELKKKGYVYENENALWFKSMSFGDDKDRVMKKSDDSLTYFAADTAYHKNKFDRGFARVIDVWGADHAGYVPRMKAVVSALGFKPENYDVVLIQLVNLIREGKLVSMSTRSATYETLEGVRTEVGKDVCRYFFLMRSHNAQLDFDLSLAKKTTPENPVYYIQYAHARIAAVMRKAQEKKIPLDFKNVDVSQLNLPEEIALCSLMSEYPKVIHKCAQNLEPHHLAFYLLKLAGAFQAYYSKSRGDDRYLIISEDKRASTGSLTQGSPTQAKLYLLKNCQIVLQNALDILGITAPDHMTRTTDE